VKILVPIRYPITEDSERTLRAAVELAEENEASLIVLHVDLYYDRRDVSSSDLRRAVRRALGEEPDAEFLVKEGLLVEETILEEAVKRGVGVVVMGRKQRSKWRRMMDKMLARPDVERFLRDEWEGEIEVVG